MTLTAGLRDLQTLVAEAGLVTPDGLARARRVQAETGERLGSILTRLGLVSEQSLVQAVARSTGLAVAGAPDFANGLLTAGEAISPRFLRDVKAAPLRLEGDAVVVALADPLEPFPLEALTVAYRRPVKPLVARASDIEAALDRAFGDAAPRQAAVDLDADDADMERLRDLASDAPAIRAVNRLISGAVEARASDIHLEPSEDSLHLRLRIDGVMRELDPLPAAFRSPVVSRIKVMAGLNIAEKRLPQDGRARLTVRGHDVDIRVATSPTIHGESAVMRLLDRSHLTLDFHALGFDERALDRLRPVLAQPHGILLVTGPTGSGKTTTLYAALSEISTPERKILTVEDPIEYRLAGINQTQVAPAIGLSFATALRSFLRQDPDVMMVGEIRDLETAQIAVQAALTGHMILSTLHTNSAASAVTRLLDMGVEPFLITSTLNGVLAQRLVRRLCPHCKEPASGEVLEEGLGEAAALLTADWRAVGCDRCEGTGYRGRIALSELLVMSPALSRLVLARSEAPVIDVEARRGGMRSMLEDGVAKVSAGETTLAEVLRVTREA